MPTPRPIPISSATRAMARLAAPSSPLDFVARARNKNRIGTQMPSFRPLSTFRPSRIGAGTDGSVTTALPRAASVGANMVAMIAISNIVNPSNSRIPAPKPSAMVSGSPKTNSRLGIPMWPLQHTEVGIGGVREQQQCQGQLRERPQIFGARVELQVIEAEGSEDQPKGTEHDGPVDRRPLEAAARNAVEKDDSGHDGQGFIHDGYSRSSVLRRALL